MVVSINDIVAKQFVLNPKKPQIISDIVLPIEYFIAGYNKITLSVAQHYTEQCEFPESSELWTQVNSVKSYFSIDSSYTNERYTLADLNKIIDKKLDHYAITLLRPNTSYNDNDLQWGSLVSQAIALRLDYKTFKLNLQQATAITKHKDQILSNQDPLRFLQQSKLNSDAVLIGTSAELADLLAPELKHKIKGAYLGVYPAQKNNAQIIIISGTTPDEVTLAAKTFAYARNAFPDTQDMFIKTLNIQPYPISTRSNIIVPGLTYQFKDLGFTTRTIHPKSKYVSLTFNMPSDLYHEPKSNVTIKLALNYGAAFRSDSVLNIRVNDIFEKAINLDNEDGDSFQAYTINIPSSTFEPGFNKISFEAVMPPVVSGDCTYMQDKNSLLTLFENSTILFPELDHYTQLPDLSLLKRTGFPYLSATNGSGLGIVLRDQNHATLLGSWQLIAKLSQINRAPLPEAKLSFKSINDRHLFIIGARNSLYDDDLAHAPIQLSENITFPYSAGHAIQEKHQSIYQSLEQLLFPESKSSNNALLQPLHTQINFNASLGSQALMVSYPSETGINKKLNTLITYDNPAVFYATMYRLVQPELWNKLNNNIAIWKDDAKSLETLSAGKTFYIGETTLRNKLAYHFSLHRNYWLLIILGLLLFVAFLSHQALKRYKLKYHSNTSEYDS
ncbi:cellulose biosynthesis cyclic di-GMP-binding regulatory protein BcsB [methanotrophic endosymbiont of Bathymodiolus puteoserpentis (Logatchev)]|uniref:cellulose biosynthesis cyclic di-GMP-binding regulatory protein BcsB n=1 Tax=methanotrophic endosymbiont of Bathymodiolus puteoserpentis (Logatchev) TaxID=343235 RepID=UPI00157A8B26|nr:cellulose biosynthesis cyclic di-GMP-binding regulatory protein BcsB [methanotrophic endosymbiont of Bathymodiolus puteoserpentis (Logatchev)]